MSDPDADVTRRAYWTEQFEVAYRFMFDAVLPYPVAECGEPLASLRTLRWLAEVVSLGRQIAFSHNEGSATAFLPSRGDDELHALLHTVIARLMKMPTRHGVLIEEMGQTWLADPNVDRDEARTLRPLHDRFLR